MMDIPMEPDVRKDAMVVRSGPFEVVLSHDDFQDEEYGLTLRVRLLSHDVRPENVWILLNELSPNLIWRKAIADFCASPRMTNVTMEIT